VTRHIHRQQAVDSALGAARGIVNIAAALRLTVWAQV
jgi:hypothetical protein